MSPSVTFANAPIATIKTKLVRGTHVKSAGQRRISSTVTMQLTRGIMKKESATFVP